jgi:hypothetical protein
MDLQISRLQSSPDLITNIRYIQQKTKSIDDLEKQSGKRNQKRNVEKQRIERWASCSLVVLMLSKRSTPELHPLVN